ncbi:MAG: hypothetical protein HY264_03695 [Chloroflexi bacterium]|nr:hypothetical protein [Chloroflexota bacterium]
MATALDADLDLIVRWRGGALDRLLDERHAALCAAVARRLRAIGYEVLIEVSYSRYGERGSIDVLGWDVRRSAIVVVEVKTELASIEATLRKHDEKIRLGPRIAQERVGQTPRIVAGLLVLPDDSTTRRRVDRQRPILDGAYPLRGHAAWAVLKLLIGASAIAPTGLVFLSLTTAAGVRARPVTRIRRGAR